MSKEIKYTEEQAQWINLLMASNVSDATKSRLLTWLSFAVEQNKDWENAMKDEISFLLENNYNQELDWLYAMLPSQQTTHEYTITL